MAVILAIMFHNLDYMQVALHQIPSDYIVCNVAIVNVCNASLNSKVYAKTANTLWKMYFMQIVALSAGEAYKVESLREMFL